MTQNEMNFIQEACYLKVNTMLEDLAKNENKLRKIEETKKEKK